MHELTPFDISVTDKLLSTTRSVRKRLDLAKPVSVETIYECIDIAQQAPTASNRQGWHWVVVTDQRLRKAIADAYRDGGGQYLTSLSTSSAEGQDARVFSSAAYLGRVIQDVPVHVIPCVAGDPPTQELAAQAAYWGSIIPAVWSFMLALRSRGLGSAYTTMHLRRSGAVAELLGIPEGWTQAALLPVAYTVGTDFKEAQRPPASEIAGVNGW